MPSLDQKPCDAATCPAVPLLDVSRQNGPLSGELEAAVSRVLATGQFVLGPEVRKLESAVAEYCGTRHAVGCASGSDALLLALMAANVGPGDEVILPSYTFFATASAVARLGATIVFVDIDPLSYNLDLAHAARCITSATKAILPVHLFGQCVDMDAINDWAKQHNLMVIEDAAQAIGAEYQGRRAGALGDMGCFSFYPTKNLGGAGDGGMVTTNDDALAERLKLLHVHGMEPRYHHSVVGINSRLDSMQAAVLNVKLPHLDAWSQQRAQNAQRYAERFAACGLDQVLTLPTTTIDGRHVWNQYIIRVPDGQRDALRTQLQESKIGCEIYYPIPLHQQACFSDVPCAEGSLPETEKAAMETLALPIFPELTEPEQQTVVDRIAAFFSHALPS